MAECIFCKIVAGTLPSYKVYEDSDTIGFLDIHPTSPGHTLVVPKKHYPDLVNTPPEVAANLVAVAQKLVPSIMDALSVPAFNISINNGAEAGQVIHHTHLHLIPRSRDDGLRPWPASDYRTGEIEEIAKKIKAKIV
ncbi:MAG: HIT family protein [Patescibacteria group bacterium]